MQQLPSTLSMSRIREFITCEQRYKYRYIDHLQPTIFQRALNFGQMGHTLLEQFYTCMKDHKDYNILEQIANLEKSIDFTDFDAKTMSYYEQDIAALQGMIEAYILHYVEEHKKHHPVYVEKHLYSKEPLHTNRGHRWILEGIPDLIIRDRNTNEIWIMDHKFLSRIERTYIRKLRMDHQAHLYFALTAEYMEMPIKGIIYNIIKKPTKRRKQRQTQQEYIQEIYDDYHASPENYFYRCPVIVTPEHTKHFQSFLRRVTWDMENVYRKEDWRRNIYECDKYGQCPFLDLCLDGDKALSFYRRRDNARKNITRENA